MPPSLRWYASNVKAAFKRPIEDGLLNIGLRIRRRARYNLTTNGQNDTKFLWNSLYVATPHKRTEIAPDGTYLSTKTAQMVERKSGPIVKPTEGVHVGAAAEYAIYPELRQSYLFRAVEQVAGHEAEEAMSGLSGSIIAPEDFNG